jgi:hypothetical protein
VLERLKQAHNDTGAPIIPLTKATIRINTVMAKRLNLTLPRTLQGLAYAP